ncbi:MAG: electron transfer flavoprotein subunit alpha/FixB family protein [Pirellulales bacterium]|nr:electron transfer flavoprotein subunit alpha/FixB family protein [Pirellulales bacterium]
MSAQDILVVAETNQDAPADITFELLGGARELAGATGGQVVAVLLGSDGVKHAAALSAADRILVIDDPQLAAFSPDAYVAVLEHVISAEGPRAVLVGCTTIGYDVAPTLAAKLNAPVVNGCKAVAVEGDALKVTCGLCGGKILADVAVAGSPAILMTLPGSFRPSEAAGQAQVETKASPVPLQPGAVTFEQMIMPEAGDVDIMQQDVLVAIGRGIQQEGNIEMAQELAETLGGELAASRPIVDQGWLPTTRQVGKSGMIVKPKLYLALGISGAPEHQEGMSGSDVIIAVNTDPSAPIFDVAHYGVEMDLLDLVEPLVEAINAKKG